METVYNGVLFAAHFSNPTFSNITLVAKKLTIGEIFTWWKSAFNFSVYWLSKLSKENEENVNKTD